jgi:drug/metabolite transporter (DMT)-like permease
MRFQFKLPPTAICLGLFIAIALDTAVQLLWKSAACAVDLNGDLQAAVFQFLSQPLFWCVACLFALQLFNWKKVLAKADLSFAQPITSLSYISVLALSALFLHERITLTQIGGVVLILAGVFFISRTDHSTAVLRGPLEP